MTSCHSSKRDSKLPGGQSAKTLSGSTSRKPAMFAIRSHCVTGGRKIYSTFAPESLTSFSQ